MKSYVTEGDAVKKGDPLVEIVSGIIFRAPFAGTQAATTRNSAPRISFRR